MLGTGGHGHVYPGATVPFGMVQLSPDNGVEGWDWCSGYHYSSSTIAGFSHTHLSGTGIGDWCDISVLPLLDTTQIRQEKILLNFSHNNETAKPGYYQVQLTNGINCQLTANNRTGYHLYTFPTTEGWLRFDMGFHLNWDYPTQGRINIVNNKTITGYRYSTGWAKRQKVYFAATFSEAVTNLLLISDSLTTNTYAVGKKASTALKFTLNKQNKNLLVRVAISSVSCAKAIEELNTTINQQSFTQTSQAAQTLWELELQKIKIDTTNKAIAQKFYTALYRTCLAPVLHSDADGQFQTHNNQVIKLPAGQQQYTVFSQWDVFRALNPLFTITQPNLVPTLINSMLQLYKVNGLLPVWDLSTWETNTMTGYHSIPIIADAMLKNITGFNYQLAYKAMLASATQKQRGTPYYIKYGYLPQDKQGWSVTVTLEYAYDDWCIAQVARKLGYTADYNTFMQRASSFKKLFDPTTGFMRAKNSNGKFIEPFDPLLSEHGFEGQYVEGTAWQHSFFVPHAVNELAMLYGGNSKLIAKLDALFTAPSELHGANASADVSGLIGQYAHGNEPSHHIIYMYTALGQPAKAAKWLRVVTDSLYKTGPDGLSGNDDCGQMSAWYVFSCLGFYPMNPASGQYVFGLPLVNNASMVMPSGKILTITVNKNGGTKTTNNPSIKRITLNGKGIPITYITHKQLLAGGNLTYYVW